MTVHDRLLFGGYGIGCRGNRLRSTSNRCRDLDHGACGSDSRAGTNRSRVSMEVRPHFVAFMVVALVVVSGGVHAALHAIVFVSVSPSPAFGVLAIVVARFSGDREVWPNP